MERGWEVDAVVLTDIPDSLWRKFLGLGRNPHRIQDVTARRKVTTESSRTDVSQFGQRGFADKTVLVVIVNHKTFIKFEENSAIIQGV